MGAQCITDDRDGGLLFAGSSYTARVKITQITEFPALTRSRWHAYACGMCAPVVLPVCVHRWVSVHPELGDPNVVHAIQHLAQPHHTPIENPSHHYSTTASALPSASNPSCHQPMQQPMQQSDHLSHPPSVHTAVTQAVHASTHTEDVALRDKRSCSGKVAKPGLAE